MRCRHLRHRGRPPAPGRSQGSLGDYVRSDTVGFATAGPGTPIRDIDFTDFSTALPAFLTIVVMPFTYSIANGIGAGFISYVLLRLATGRAQQVHVLMWVVALAFVGYFAVGPIQSLFGG